MPSAGRTVPPPLSRSALLKTALALHSARPRHGETEHRDPGTSLRHTASSQPLARATGTDHTLKALRPSQIHRGTEESFWPPQGLTQIPTDLQQNPDFQFSHGNGPTFLHDGDLAHHSPYEALLPHVLFT